jgi:hypothetical protein
MKKISLVVDQAFLNNEVFNTNSAYNFDNFFSHIHLLKNTLKQYNYEIATHDIIDPKDSDITFYFNLGNKKLLPNTQHEINKSFLFLWECQIITPDIYNKNIHNLFNKVFTFDDSLIDNQKYYKINYSYINPDIIPIYFKEKNKFLILISANKFNNNPNELYSERVKAIRWFENNTSNLFDLYGKDWDIYTSKNRYIRKLGKLNLFFYKISKFLFFKKFISYKGQIKSKIDILKQYKFAICYENANNINGYITEKIFHCFFSYCIPIYLGAPNIQKHIPEGCYIDKRNFKTYNELYNYIKNIDENEYNKYIDNINNFLKSNKFNPFNAEYFVKSIIDITGISHEK